MSTLNDSTFVLSTPTPSCVKAEQERLKLRQAVIEDWLRTTNEAIEAMFKWRANLQVWHNFPNAIVPDEYFMILMQDMDEAMLLDWLDVNSAGLDRLREAVTQKEVSDV